ncbi:MAG: hypothetical protein ABI024_10745 [Vicinamibacterales bacterium]
MIDALNAANALKDGEARTAAVQAARAKAPPGNQRVFVGKDRCQASVVNLFDANGKARLVLKLEAGAAASIDFLDADGTVPNRLPTYPPFPPAARPYFLSLTASFVLSMALSIFSPAFSAGPFSGQATVASTTAARDSTRTRVRMVDRMRSIMADGARGNRAF